MIFATPKNFVRVKESIFRWYLKRLGGTKATGANGTGYYDDKGNLAALETHGCYYVRP